VILVDVKEITKHILDFLLPTYSDVLISMYGIGSSFWDSFGKVSDVDIIVLLKNTSSCPVKSYTTALFEDYYTNGVTFTFLYGTLDDYLDKKKFDCISFSDYAWSVRSLKFGSKHLWGEDIRNQLPIPKYDYRSILLRSAYHLNGSSKRYSKQIKLTKAIFKFGFYLTVVYYPNENIFNKKGIFGLLKQAVEDGYISEKMVKYYEMALHSRKENDDDIVQKRLEFIRYWVEETLRSTTTSWKELRNILINGFGTLGFGSLVAYIDMIADDLGLPIE
jgi:hypothetical protein